MPKGGGPPECAARHGCRAALETLQGGEKGLTPGDTLTIFDLIILAVIAVSAGLGFVRGLSREAITLFSLGAAVFLSIWGAPKVAPLIGGTFASAIAAYAALFALGFIIITVTLELVAGRFLGRDPVGPDRIAGAVFGVLRGWLLMGLVYLASTYYFDEDNPPRAIDGALLKGVVSAAASLLESFGIERDVAETGEATEPE